MTSPHDNTRRALLAGLAGTSLAAMTPAGNAIQPARANPKTLVAFFSRSGNTKVIAGLIKRAFDADWFEIRPASPYPDDYLATVRQATEERDNGVLPRLAAAVPGIPAYDTIFLGFPIWGETAPPVIRSFLQAHDLSGKTVVPFVTHGGYGLGGSQSVLARHAPRARLQQPFSMHADQERQTMNTVNAWLKTRIPA